MELAIAEAAKAGRWDIVAQLAGILQDRGRESSGNVYTLDLGRVRR